MPKKTKKSARGGKAKKQGRPKKAVKKKSTKVKKRPAAKVKKAAKKKATRIKAAKPELDQLKIDKIN